MNKVQNKWILPDKINGNSIEARPIKSSSGTDGFKEPDRYMPPLPKEDSFALISGTPEDHRHPDQTNCGSDPIVQVRGLPVYPPSPQKGQDNENAAVSRVNPPEVREALHRRDDSIEKKDNSPDNPVPIRAVFSQPKPYDLAPADFRQARKDKENCRFCHNHYQPLNSLDVPDF